MKKKIITIAVVAILLAAAITGLCIYLHNAKYISKAEAVNAAIKDAAIEVTEIIKTDAEFEKTSYAAWYDVEVDTLTTEFEYVVDAKTGEVLSSSSEPRD